MARFLSRFLLAALVLALFVSLRAEAANTTTSSIQVSDMHCGTCAKKIARKLFTVPGVLKVSTNLSTHTATVTPQADKQPAPKALWEAVEQAGFKPVKLTTPAGTFEKKPE